MPPYAGNLTFNVSRHILDYLVSKVRGCDLPQGHLSAVAACATGHAVPRAGPAQGNALSPEAGQLGNAQIAYLPPDGDYVLAASDPRKDGAPAAAPS